MTTYLIVYFGSVIVAMLLVPIISLLAKRYNMLDNPGPRKVHKIPVPRIGGIPILLGTVALVLPVFFLNNTIGESFRQEQTQLIVLLVGACFIFLVGLIDDIRSLPGGVKLLSLVIAALAVCASGATIGSFSMASLFSVHTGWTAWPLTVFWIVGVAVCIGVIDGLDGLAAGIGAMVCGILVILSIWSNQQAMAALMLALLGSLTGFLFFNFYPAKIFMGDCGSLFLGFMVGAGSVVCQMKTSTIVGLAIPFLVLGVPILDTGLVIACRAVVERRSLFAPDRNHFHHRLLRLGLKHRAVVIVMYSMTAISASLGIFMLRSQGKWSMAILVVGLLLIFTMFACLQRGRLQILLKGIKRNLVIAHKARVEQKRFEDTQIKMRESGTFSEWWQTLCSMANLMRFYSIELAERQNGYYVNTCTWNAPDRKVRNGKIVRLSLPMESNEGPERELRVCIFTEDYLELGGRQAMLLTRLIDEFPIPEYQQQAKDIEQTDNNIARLQANSAIGTPTRVVSTFTHRKVRPTYLPKPFSIMGFPVVPFRSYDQALECAKKVIDSQDKTLWFAINPIKMYHAWHNPELRGIIEQADVGLCDGVGIKIASKILNGRSLARITGCDLFFRLIAEASRNGWGVYMLGAAADVNAAARVKLKEKFPGLKIVGWQDGYFKDSDRVVDNINSSGADLLFVALGSPKQEQWIHSHWAKIKVRVCMGVGGSFDIAAGHIKRAPKFFQMTGTEFLYRLLSEPWKRWPIQKVLFPYFLQVLGKKAVDITLVDENAEESEQ